MASLKPRHAFIASRVADGLGVDEEEVKNAVRKYVNKINDFLVPNEGTTSSSSHLLAYYQPRDIKNEVCVIRFRLLVYEYPHYVTYRYIPIERTKE